MRNWNRKTSSSKLSSVSTSFSTAAKGNFNHNRRTNSKVPQNVDPTKTAFNKILIDKDIRQVYDEVFGESIAEYNANQIAKKHPERQKKDYYSSICHDKKTEPFREAVVQIGNKDKQLPRWESNEILQKFLKRFQENNPQLVVVGAYIHNDEATPHMHIDYVPVATYSKGLKKRVSNDKALNQMGYKTWNDWKDSQMACLENLVREKGYDREYMNNSNRHIADVEQFKRVQKEVERQANNKLEKMELPDIPAPEIKINPINKSESVRFTKAEFEQIKQVINYQQIQITSLEAQKSTLNTDLEISKQTINRIKNKPYVLENERLSTELEKNKSKTDKFDEISVQNQQLKNQINTLNNLQVENNNLKLELEKEKQRSENFKIIGKLYQCMYLHLMNHIIPSVIQKFKIVELIRNGLDNLFTGVLDEYQNKSKNPDIYTQLFQDNTSLNKSYPDIDQEFSNLPDVDELIEKYFTDAKKDIQKKYKPSKARIIQCENKATAKKALKALKNGTDPEEVAQQYMVDSAKYSGKETLVTTKTTDLSTRLINTLSKTKKAGVIDEVFTNESSGTTYAYVAVLVSNTYKDIKDDVYTTLSSDDDVTKACLVYYLKKYNFEVHDQDVFNNLKTNNPEYLVSRPDLSKSDD